jgi:hypothetical protein
MTDWFPPIEGVHILGWIGGTTLGATMIATGGTVVTAYGGFLLGFCLLWAWLRFRYEEINLRTAVDEVEE